MATFKYPLQRFENDYDFFAIESIQYQPPGLGQGGTAFQLGDGDTSNINGSATSTIFLPMPMNIADNNSANWEADRLNGVDATIVNATGQAVTDLSLGNVLRDPIKAASQTVEGLTNTAADALDKITGQDKDAIKQFLVAKAVGRFRNVNANSVIARTTGKVVNPNLELLFKSPELRAFEYQFEFTPRSSAESDVVKNIIRTLKQDSAPKKGNGGGLFLTTPNVFRLSFRRGQNLHPFLNQFKICALKGMRVDYTSGTGGYRVYEDSTPVKMTMNLSFTELTPIYNEDFQGNSGGVGF